MINHISGTDLQLLFKTKINGEFVVPDSGSLKLTLRDTTATIRPGFDQKLLPDTAINVVKVTIPASENTLVPGSNYETRFARLEFTSQGKASMVEIIYRIIRFIPYTVTPDSVRETLGVSIGELDDSAVDLYKTYLKLSSNSAFAAAIVSNDLKTIYANDVLRLTEALELAPSLRARILKGEEKDNSLYTRFNFDFNELIAQLRSALLEAQQAWLNASGDVPVIGVTIFRVSVPVDRVTGV